MLIIQEYNSLAEIDPEFHTEIMNLLPLEFSHFEDWISFEKSLSEEFQFYYYCFFTSEKNSPIGFAQAQMTLIDPTQYLPWYKKLKHQFFHELNHWKIVKWYIGQGFYGPLIIAPKYYRAAKDLLQKKIIAMENRPEIVAQTLVSNSEMSPLKTEWQKLFFQETKKCFYVDCLNLKNFESYEYYLKTLPPEVQTRIKNRWKELHKSLKLRLQREANHLIIEIQGKKLLTLFAEVMSNHYLKIHLPIDIPKELNLLDLIQISLLEFFNEEQIKDLLFCRNQSFIKTQNLNQLSDFETSLIPIKSQDLHHYSRSPYVH